MSEFVVRHQSHPGLAIGEIQPENLSFGDRLNDPDTISYDMDFTHDMCNPLKTKPFNTDWILFKNGNPLLGGFHTEVSISDFSDNAISIAGAGWLEYLNHRMWPFDPTNPTANPFIMFQQDLFYIVEQMLNNVLALPDSLPLSYSNGTCGILGNLNIEPGDTEMMLGKISTLSKTLPGFDYKTTWDKKYIMYSPRRGSDNSLILEQDTNIMNLGSSNKGIGGTHTLALGSGGGLKLGAVYDDPIQRVNLRRLDAVRDFGEISDPALMAQLAASEGQRQATPIRTITCKWVGNDDIWSMTDIGDSLKVRGDTGYEVVDDIFRLVGREGAVTQEGDEEVTLTFDDGTINL